MTRCTQEDSCVHEKNLETEVTVVKTSSEYARPKQSVVELVKKQPRQ